MKVLENWVLVIPAGTVALTLSVMDFRPYEQTVETVAVEPLPVQYQKSGATKIKDPWFDFIRTGTSDKVYRVNKQIKLTDKEVQCLAHNIFYEAGIEDMIGKLMVAEVTYNRIQDSRWGQSWCEVVYEHKQFSWTLKKQDPPHGKNWVQSIEAAFKFASQGFRVHGLQDALYYHADYINKPNWDYTKLTKIGQIGKHIIYRDS